MCIKHPQDIVTKIGFEWTLLDPKSLININLLPAYNYFTNILDDPEVTITETDLLNSALKNKITEILSTESYSFMTEHTLVSSDYLIKNLSWAKNYVNQTYLHKNEEFKRAKLDYVEALICQMIALRLHKEIIYRDLPFPRETLTRSALDEDFKALGKELVRMQSRRTLRFEGAFSSSNAGYSVSNNPMQSLRLNVSNNAVKLDQNVAATPLNIWQTPNIVSIFYAELRILINEKRATHGNREGEMNLEFKFSRLRNKLTRRFGVHQFPPIIVGQLILFLHQELGISISSVLDLCAGWGDRLVGVLVSLNTISDGFSRNFSHVH